MSNRDIDLRAAWNRSSAVYLAEHAAAAPSIHYGPWAPDELRLGLLGNVSGLRVLEIGCGGGQCAVAFARAGAQVTALDLSDRQVEAARRLAAEEKAAVVFIQGAAEEALSRFDADAFDLIFSTYALHYVREIGRCLSECSRVLAPGGRLVFSFDHPLRNCFWDEADGELVVYPALRYLAEQTMSWTFAGAAMQTIHRPVGRWLDLLHGAGFRLLRLVEPHPPADLLDALWPADGALAPLRQLPQAIIFVAERAQEHEPENRRGLHG